MFEWYLRAALLDRFDGGEGGGMAGPSAAPGGSQPGIPGDAPAGGQETPPDAGESNETNHEDTKTPAERRKAFRTLINGEYKDAFSEEFNQLFNRRSQKYREQLQSHQGLIDLLSSRYGVEDGDVSKLQAAIEADDALWQEKAEEAGMDLATYKRVQQMEAENRRLRAEQQRSLQDQLARQTMSRWAEQERELKGLYPTFDLRGEMSNPAFVAMLRAGAPMRNVFEAVHMDEIKRGLIQAVQKDTEKAVTDHIRARGARPSEGGGGSAGVSVSEDVHKLTRQQREELARRAERGETITFRK